MDRTWFLACARPRASDGDVRGGGRQDRRQHHYGAVHVSSLKEEHGVDEEEPRMGSNDGQTELAPEERKREREDGQEGAAGWNWTSRSRRNEGRR